MSTDELPTAGATCTQCQCGLPTEASFCWRCGDVRRSTSAVADADSMYEVCAIVYGKSLTTDRVVFSARASRADGPFTAAESAPLTYEAHSYLGGNSPAVLDRLLADLAAQGWEHLGTYGAFYWDRRLRRLVRSTGASGRPPV